MNDIQKNYLIGLVLKKVRNLNLDALKDVNISNDDFLNHIETFVETNSSDMQLINKIIAFLESDEIVYMEADLNIEKIGLYNNIKTKEYSFTINQNDFMMILLSLKSYLKEYLPLGTIVKVKDVQTDEESLVMIEQRMIHLKGKNYFIDYRAIPYPMGIFNEQMYLFFSTEEVLEVVYLGYSDFENEGYELALKESLIDNNIFSVDYRNQNN